MSLPLRSDFDADADAVSAAAKKPKGGFQARRLLALAAISDGMTRTEAARIGGVPVQIVRDWIVKFNAQGPEGLVDREPPKKPLFSIAASTLFTSVERPDTADELNFQIPNLTPNANETSSESREIPHVSSSPRISNSVRAHWAKSSAKRRNVVQTVAHRPLVL